MNRLKPDFPSLLRSPLFLLGVILLAPFLPILLHPAGRILGNEQGDNPAMFFYYNYFAGHCWHQGALPLWNPYVMLGHPFLGEGQAALFHPLSWLFIALPAGAAINWISALCFLFAGLAFYGYLRALDLAKDTSFCGALVWSFSNVMISRIYAGHITNTLIFFELPLLFLLWERYRRSRDLRWLVGLAATYALMILAAHPQFLYIFSLFFMLYVLLQASLELKAPGGAAAQGRAILLLGVFVLLGIGIGLVQLLPSADFAGQSARTKASYSFSTIFSFDPENLITFIVPRFFGYTREAGPAQYWGRDFLWEMWVYFGILPLILAVPGVLAAPARRRIPLLVCASVFFVIALGRFTPLFPLVYKYVPLFNVFRGPSKNMMVTEFCLVTFSAFGLEALLHPLGGPADRRRLNAALIFGGVLLVLVIGVYCYYIPGFDVEGSNWSRLFSFVKPKIRNLPIAKAELMVRFSEQELLRAAFFILLALGLLTQAWRGMWRRALLPLALLLILVDPLCVFAPLLFKTYPLTITEFPPELIAPLRSAPYPPRVLGLGFTPFSANISMRHEYSSPSGYTGTVLLRYNTFVNAVLDQPLGIPQVANPLGEYRPAMRLLSLDAMIMPQAMLKPDMQVLARADERALVSFSQPFPRAWLAAAPRAITTGSDDALHYVLAPEADLQLSPAVELEPSASLPPAAPLAPDETVKITAFSPNRVELEAHTARPRLLALAEMYEKNWTATVNGRPAAVFPANYLFRGVELPAGDSRIVFAYRPASFRHGALLSLLALAGLFGIGLRAALWPKPLVPAGAPAPQREPARSDPPATPRKAKKRRK